MMKLIKFTTRLLGVLMLVSTFFISATTFAQEAKVIELKGLNSMEYDKTEITAKPGQKITIRLTTESDFKATAMSHNFVLLKQTADVKALIKESIRYSDNDYIAPDMTDQIIAYTAMASGGETVEVTFTAPTKPSKYMFICTFPGHFLAGMKGTLTVEN